MAIKNSEQHVGLNGWYNRSCKHWTELRGKSVGELVTNPVGLVGGRVAEEVRSLTDVSTYTDGTKLEGLGLMPLNKLWRAKLILNRSKSPFDKIETGGVDPATLSTTRVNPTGSRLSYNLPKKRDLGREAIGLQVVDPENLVIEDKSPEYKGRSVSENRTYLSERSQKAHVSSSGNSIIIVSPYTSPYVSLELQCRPNEVQVTPQGTWAAVSSMGRNNPFRMYTGGEDTIQFDINWYCDDPNNRGEVVTKCRLLESWSKANGYSSAPPVLQLLWGQSNIYKDDFFILESASYKLSHFQNMALKRGDPNKNEVGDRYLNLGLYPNYATQTLVFKRVSSVNRTWDHIVSIEDLKKTRGITVTE